VEIDDDCDVVDRLLQSRARMSESSDRLPSRRDRQRLKRQLNLYAINHMTPALLSERDPDGELVNWLARIGRALSCDRR
jgi:hypothetical protein